MESNAIVYIPEDWIADKRLSCRAFRLASSLLICADSDGQVRLTLHQLTRLFRRGRMSVSTTLAELEESGYILRFDEETDYGPRKVIEFNLERFPDGRFKPADWVSDAARLAFIRSLNQGPRETHRAPIPHHIRKAVMERDAYRCQECGGYQDLCIDHVYPLSRGGTTALGNLQTLCRPCNSRKGARVDLQG